MNYSFEMKHSPCIAVIDDRDRFYASAAGKTEEEARSSLKRVLDYSRWFIDDFYFGPDDIVYRSAGVSIAVNWEGSPSEGLNKMREMVDEAMKSIW